MLRAFPVRQFRVEQAVDGVDLAGRGPAGEFVDARLGDEQLAGLLVEPFVRLRVFCQVGVGRFGVSFSPCERRVSGRFGVGRSCWLLVIALVIA